MKIRIVEDPNLEEDMIIHCRVLTAEIERFVEQTQSQIILAEHRGREISIDIREVLFFETENDAVFVHASQNSYLTKYRLYELENALPAWFMRISKSTIINSDKVSSLERNLTSSRSVQFQDSTKMVYVSRMYYSLLKDKLKERSIL